jgi:hypothetical protein
MRRTLAAAAIALGLHTLAFLFLEAYRDLPFRAGRPFCRATDIADIGCIVLLGFIVLAIVAVVAGILLERLDRVLWRAGPK